jgi:hypothetical protein
MAAYLHDGIALYLDRLYDWDDYFRLRKGDDVDVDAERAALVGCSRPARDRALSLAPRRLVAARGSGAA